MKKILALFFFALPVLISTAQYQNISGVRVGDQGHGATWPGIGNNAITNTGNYMLIQSQDGHYTLLNKANTGAGYIGFRVGNADKMVILNNGNMGIGHVAPLKPLDINGELLVRNRVTIGGYGANPATTQTWHLDNVGNRLRIFMQPNINTAGSEVFTIDNGLRVGIGTTAPTQKLHVAGTSRLDDDIYFGNWRISKNASNAARDHIGYFAGANKNIMGLAYDINSGNSIIGLAHHGGSATTSYPVGTIRLASQTAANNGKKESVLIGGIGGIYVDPGELSFGIGFDYGVTLANGNPDHDAVFIIRNPRHHRTQIELLSAQQTGDLLKINGEVCITANGTCDYVFKDDYKLRSIGELEEFIKKNGHLPGVKNDKEIKEAGMVNVLEQSNALLEKTEEFSLYIIELNRKLEQQQVIIQQQQRMLNQLLKGER